MHRFTTLSWPRWLACATALAVAAPAADYRPGTTPGKTTLVKPDAAGRLTYQPYSPRGDVLPDFSHSGYGRGGVPIPDVVTLETLTPDPAGGDDSARIQAALDRVGGLPPGRDGRGGAVLLKRGTYSCATPLQITASGVVLRGEGDGPDGTILTATGRRQQPLVVITGAPPQVDDASAREITDDYVPVGARTFTVADASDFAVGQTVFVVRRGNAAWISALGMDRIVPRPANPAGTKQWAPFDLRFDRVITAVAGNRITVDAPLTCAVEKIWGGGAVVRYSDLGRIEQCGVESLRAVSIYDATKTEQVGGKTIFTDEDHATHLVAFRAVKNAWARRLTSVHFFHGPAKIAGTAKWITVEDCHSLAPVSRLIGGRRYPYNIEGQLNLVQRCTSEHARHAFVFGARVPGPNVFRECRSEHDHATSEPHHRWSVGGLYDNVETTLAIQDRQWFGSGHGWAGANYVVWNGRGTLVCQQPPTAQNFAIGFVGRRGKEAFTPRTPGWWESEGQPVEPRSLYLAQLRARQSP